jgi:hypothetical protein
MFSYWELRGDEMVVNVGMVEPGSPVIGSKVVPLSTAANESEM